MVLTVTGVYLLSAIVGYVSCSQSAILPSDVAPNSFGTFDFDELKDIIYDIEILKVPIPEPVEGFGGTNEDIIKDLDGGTGVEDVEQTMVPPVGGDSKENTREEKNEGVDKIEGIETAHSQVFEREHVDSKCIWLSSS